MRFLDQGTTKHMDVTAVAKNNASLNVRAVTFAISTVGKLIGKPHVNRFHRDRLIP